MDLCAADSSRCYMEKYVELTWSIWLQVLTDTKTSQDDWVKAWAQTVSDKFSIPVVELNNIFDRNKDTHNTDWRVREMWKYGASIGVSGTPVVFVNGVKLNNYPADEATWVTLFETLYPKIIVVPAKIQDAQAFVNGVFIGLIKEDQSGIIKECTVADYVNLGANWDQLQADIKSDSMFHLVDIAK